MQETWYIYHKPRQYMGRLTFEYTEEEGQWVGVCTELGTSSFGHTLEEAKSDLADAVSLQLSEADRMGFAWDLLAERVPPAAPDEDFTLLTTAASTQA